MTRLFSYIIVSDAAFSPNPFHGQLTLACCKPRIRARARPGDLVVGLSRGSKRIVHAFKVGETLTFAEYWADRRFIAKRPKWKSRRIIDRCGDNIYEPDGGGGFVQHPSQHYNHEEGRERPVLKQRDLSADVVLVAGLFTYFGGEGPLLPKGLAFLKAGRGHRSRFTEAQIANAHTWFKEQPRGVRGRPTIWSDSDVSWSEVGGGEVGVPVVARAPVVRRSRRREDVDRGSELESMAPRRVVLSRKGFDSSTGRVPSPILPDGTLVSLPIPERASATRFEDIAAGGRSMGELVQQLTRGAKLPHFGAHLDPDLDAAARPRAAGWRPMFGQANAAQELLEREGVEAGDLFLFFGWFRQTEEARGELRYRKGAPDLHALFGWLQVGHVLRPLHDAVPTWAREHPHVAQPQRPNNAVYVASDELVLGGQATGLSGGGVFSGYREELRLTAEGETRSVWDVPEWFAPTEGRAGLGMHRGPERWALRGERARLRTVGRGQEFVLPVPMVGLLVDWMRTLLDGANPRS